jgi:DNA-binding cell septation regulator SpoVG
VTVSGTPGADAEIAEIVINRALRISDIHVYRSGGTVKLVFPRNVSRKGRVFPHVRLLTHQAEDAVRAAVVGGAPSGKAAGALTYRVAGCTIFKKKSRLKGVAEVRFNEAVAVECRLVNGRNGTWILWPADKRRRALVAVTDKRMKESIEQDILDRLDEMAAEGEQEDE